MESAVKNNELNKDFFCTRIKIIENEYDLDEFSAIFDAFSNRIETDIDFLKFCLTHPINDKPKFVIAVALEQKSPTALIIGRILLRPLQVKLGYKSLFKIKAMCFEILYDGMLGDLTDHQVIDILNQLSKFIKQNNIDYLFIRSLREDSKINTFIDTNINLFNRNFIVDSKLRWGIQLPNSFDEYYHKRSRKTRANIRRFRDRIERSFSGSYKIKCYTNEPDVEKIFRDIEQISAKSWQREMGVGFSKTDERLRNWKYFASRNLMYTYFLYVGEKPVAYWNCIRYKKKLLGDFTGYDPEFKYYSPSLFLMMEMLSEVISKGGVEFLEFGLIDAHYKREYCNVSFSEADRYIFNDSIKGLVLWMIYNLATCINRFIKYILGNLKILEKVKSNWRKKITVTTQK
jgi:hypothetical protein